MTLEATPQNVDTQKPQEVPTPTDEELLQGGPVPEVVASEEVSDDPAPDAPVFKWGDKEFQTQEELAAFISDLDKKATKNQGYEEALAKLNVAPPAPAEEIPEVAPKLLVDGKPVGEAIWEDPDKALDAAVTEAVTRATTAIREEQVQQKQVDDLWDGFYTKNPDLGDMQDQVNMVLAKNKAELFAMPTSDALKKLASLTRGEMKRVKEKFSETENLGNSPAVVASSTPAAPQEAPTEEVVKDVAFIDQLRQFQSKHF